MKETLFDPETGKLRDPDAFRDHPRVVPVSVRGDTHVRTDERGATIVRKSDGRQGVTVRPKLHVGSVRHGEAGRRDR